MDFEYVLMVLILGLATYRVLRLVAWDDILNPVRDATLHRSSEKINEFTDDQGKTYKEKVNEYSFPKTREMFACPWCVGFWASLIGALPLYFEYDLVHYGLGALAISTIVGIIGSSEVG